MRELERDNWTHKADSPSDGAPRTLAIVGAGRVGGAIARAARSAGLAVQLAGRDDAVEACRDAEAALLCVPDAAIADAVEGTSIAGPPLRSIR
jgi:phosphoglycerate dehydrogenase-like enzyme